MAIIFLESKDNAKIKHLRGLIELNSARKKHQQTVLEGTHLCLAWLQQQKKIFSLFTTEQALENSELQQVFELHQGHIFVISEVLYKDLSTLGTTLPCLAIIDLPQNPAQIDFTQDTLILENVQDPGNVGTLLRSAAAANIKQVICTQGSASLWSPRVLRAGMGAHFSLVCFENIQLEDILPQFKIPVFVTSSHRSTSLYSKDLTQACVWILGNEGQGASNYALEHAEAVAIPQPGGQESLNVAIAGSICFFEMVRQRQ
ncbi:MULTISPECIES: TrmH family RNA methyltransferase [Acinetobacter]|jgi:TrmH family RNA methyltransferase|uniref:TrmH family RNA methyltransferase n=1 Tax=Acinetobacter TaxID=469 RepID=UPI0003B91479|nr:MULTISPECIES: RNA methyltransferase [Acinetobacter]ERP95062.1 rRNA methyltransferase [Acinetobacter sp. COS3]KXO82558.1 rRNA methyltransferase [Acinetobacter venetianus]MBC70049.1 RNA methyltransferase [Acinetobacter sp.]MBT50321.1 RNA methyltransferase [Acinetobacter sp.]RZG86715.1 RNA methyltransferase [Acinetobacter venetianus]|tara:strand:- start:1038 stop:1814 length:777 start_codon:yes stop_codon:yes gene_type:complete